MQAITGRYRPAVGTTGIPTALPWPPAYQIPQHFGERRWLNQLNLLFSYKEVVTALLKQQGIHEGIWSLATQLSESAPSMPGQYEQLSPAAIVPLLAVGIQKGTELTTYPLMRAW